MKENTISSRLPPDPTLISETLRAKLPFSSGLHHCSPLAGDASNRRHNRLQLVGSPVSSIILMHLADPEGFKASEEAVSETSADVTELPFVNVLSHLRQAGVSVPALYYYDKPAGLLYLEDLGDVTLVQACVIGGKANRECLYIQAVDRLVEMHLRATFPQVLERLGASAEVRERAQTPINRILMISHVAAFDKETASWVYDFYRDDFVNFGYDRDNWLFDYKKWVAT